MQRIGGEDSLGRLGGFLRERVTSGFPVITTDHALIHEGLAYTLSATASISNGATHSVELAIPAGVYVHFKPVGVTASGGPVTITLVEGSTSTGGSAATPSNRRRISPVASRLTCKTGVTASGGTVIDTALIPSATQGNNRLGAGTGAAEEFVLNPGTTYSVQFANAAGNATTIGYQLFWYEEPGA